MIALIVAKASNDVIGGRNDLPWYLPADLQRFKQLTTGHTVIMGRKTCQSIHQRLHGPLPNRRSIVLSKSSHDLPTGFERAASLEQAFQMVPHTDTTFVIGGASIYKQCLDQQLIDEIYLTDIKQAILGDTYFPDIDWRQWQEVKRESHHKDEHNPYDYDFVVLKKR